MCGIVGVLRSPAVAACPSILDRMAATLRHRGPDDAGTMHEPGVSLAHQRLSIIDLATGHQPMTAGAHTIVFNGEIYNYRELREGLRAAGRTFHTASDTEVLLQLYDAYGPSFVRQLNGIFAFLLYDRERQVVLAARDHFGVKPLYWTTCGDAMLFASEIKAFWQYPGMEPRVHHAALREYLTLQFVTGEETLFEGVQKLPPAHCLEVELASGRTRQWQYWAPRFGCDRTTSEASFVEQTRALLEDAVRLQLRSDVPVGCYLSGGLDSSIVTTLAAREQPIVAFTGRFDAGPAFDEAPYARLVARAVGAELQAVIPKEAEFPALLPPLV